MRILGIRERLQRGERGSIIILFAFLLTFLIGVTALVIDLGYARTTRLALQNHADSAALAGTFELPTNPAKAREVAADYVYMALDQTAPVGEDCGTESECFNANDFEITVTTPSADSGTIRVTACTSTPAFFGGALGFYSISVCGKASASVTAATSPDCVICLLDPTGTTMSSTGAGTVDVVGGGIVVNSSSSSAITLTGGGKIRTDGTFGVYGGYSSTEGALTPLPTYHLPVSDPLADVPVPSVPGGILPKVSISGSANMTLSPGVYSEIVSSSSGQITLEPGIYVVTREIKLSKSAPAGGVSLLAHGVTIYFACQAYPTPCSPLQSGGTLSMSGGTSVSWSPPSTGPYKGLSVFFDRNNEATFGLTGSSTSTFAGTIYMKSGELSMTGPSGVSNSMQSALVVGSLKKTGDSSISIDYNADLNPPMGGSGGGGRRLTG